MVGFKAVPDRLVPRRYLISTPTHTRVPARLQQKTHRAAAPVPRPSHPREPTPPRPPRQTRAALLLSPRHSGAGESGRGGFRSACQGTHLRGLPSTGPPAGIRSFAVIEQALEPAEHTISAAGEPPAALLRLKGAVLVYFNE